MDSEGNIAIGATGPQGYPGEAGAPGATNPVTTIEAVAVTGFAFSAVGTAETTVEKAAFAFMKSTDCVIMSWSAASAGGDGLVRVVSDRGNRVSTYEGKLASGSVAVNRPYALYYCVCEGEHSEACLVPVTDLSAEHPKWSIIHLSSDDARSVTVDDTFGFWGAYGVTTAIETTYAQCTGGCGTAGVNHAKKDCGHCVEYAGGACGTTCTGCKKYRCNGVAHGICADCGEYTCVSGHAAEHASWLAAVNAQEDDDTLIVEESGGGEGTNASTCVHDFSGVGVDPSNPGSYFPVCTKCGQRQ